MPCWKLEASFKGNYGTPFVGRAELLCSGNLAAFDRLTACCWMPFLFYPCKYVQNIDQHSLLMILMDISGHDATWLIEVECKNTSHVCTAPSEHS